MSAENRPSALERAAATARELVPIDWDALRHFGAEPVPNHLKRWWWCLGGTPLYLFIIQVVTGALLTFYYVPSPETAYASVDAITNEIRFGWFIRSIHKWSANFMIIAVFLHMLRVYFTGAYRHPRQLNWVIGLGLLACTLTFGFTGYSLVYEQLSFWGATVACNLADAVPVVGPHIAHFLRGGPEVGAQTLTRFYVLHIGILPTAMFALIGLHVLLIRLHGVTELKFEDESDEGSHSHFPFWPHHATTELLIGVSLMYLLTLTALIFPVGLGAPADPTVTPAHIKPEWYFYASFRLLKLTSLDTSVALTAALGGGALFWPWIESRLRAMGIPEGFSVALGVFAFFGFLILTVWEAISLH